MKNTMMMMVGAAAGIGIYMGVEKMTKNKKVIKRKLNTIIDDTIIFMAELNGEEFVNRTYFE